MASGVIFMIGSNFQCYLSDRYQFVNIKGECSEILRVSKGVPQETFLGPILFLLTINDICNCSTAINTIYFAYFSTIYAAGDNLNTLTNQINLELKKVERWLLVNNVLLNIVAKPNLMMFSYKKM